MLWKVKKHSELTLLQSTPCFLFLVSGDISLCWNGVLCISFFHLLGWCSLFWINFKNLFLATSTMLGVLCQDETRVLTMEGNRCASPKGFCLLSPLGFSTQGNDHPQSTSRGVLVYTLNVSIQFLLRISTPILQRSHLELKLLLVKINHTTGRDWSCWRRDSVIHVDVCSWDAPQCTERYKVKSSSDNQQCEGKIEGEMRWNMNPHLTRT